MHSGNEPNDDLYDLLKVSPNVSSTALAKAWRRVARNLHPDRHPEAQKESAEAAFARASAAYSVLSDASQRWRYDQHLYAEQMRAQRERARTEPSRRHSASPGSASPAWTSPQPPSPGAFSPHPCEDDEELVHGVRNLDVSDDANAGSDGNAYAYPFVHGSNGPSAAERRRQRQRAARARSWNTSASTVTKRTRVRITLEEMLGGCIKRLRVSRPVQRTRTGDFVARGSSQQRHARGVDGSAGGHMDNDDDDDDDDDDDGNNDDADDSDPLSVHMRDVASSPGNLALADLRDAEAQPLGGTSCVEDVVLRFGPGTLPGTSVSVQCGLGTFVVELEEQPHPRFMRVGYDLVYVARLTMEEALRGTTLLVEPLQASPPGATTRPRVPSQLCVGGGEAGGESPTTPVSATGSSPGSLNTGSNCGDSYSSTAHTGELLGPVSSPLQQSAPLDAHLMRIPVPPRVALEAQGTCFVVPNQGLPIPGKQGWRRGSLFVHLAVEQPDARGWRHFPRLRLPPGSTPEAMVNASPVPTRTTTASATSTLLRTSTGTLCATSSHTRRVMTQRAANVSPAAQRLSSSSD